MLAVVVIVLAAASSAASQVTKNTGGDPVWKGLSIGTSSWPPHGWQPTRASKKNERN